MVRKDILQKFADLFGVKKVNDRELSVEETITSLTRELRPSIAAALTARRKLLESPAPVREKYAWPKWDHSFEDSISGRFWTFRQIVQGLIDNFLGRESEWRWRFNDDVPISKDAHPLMNPGLELTGPWHPLDMAFNALNSPAPMNMPDFEDASPPHFQPNGTATMQPVGIFAALLKPKEICERRDHLAASADLLDGSRAPRNVRMSHQTDCWEDGEMKAGSRNTLERIGFSKSSAVIADVVMDQSRSLQTALCEEKDSVITGRRSATRARTKPCNKFDVFLAHNSKDKRIVEQIAELLRRRRIKIWFDKWILPPGRPFQEEIEKALPRVKAIAVFVGSSGLGRWERMELRSAIGYFVEQERPVIPVLLPGVLNASQLPPFLREFSAVHFATSRDLDALNKLIWGITGINPSKAGRHK
jgi:nucleotide-binding universal stress UspA family protein